MWRGTRSFFCIDPKEPYLEQTEGRGLAASAPPLPSIHRCAWKVDPRKVNFRFTAFSEVGLWLLIGWGLWTGEKAPNMYHVCGVATKGRMIASAKDIE